MLDRRAFLAGTALAGAAAAIPLSTVRVRAQAAGGTAGGLAQAPAFHRIRVGDAIVTALADGTLQMGAAAFPDVSEEEFAAAMRAAHKDPAAYAGHVNAYLIQQGDRTVLMDAGGTSAMAPSLGQLPANLAAAGVDPADIDTILISHLHPDHIGALTTDGTAMFPNAELMVRENEVAFWADPATRAALPAGMQGMIDGIEAALAPYEGRTTRFAEDGEVAPGIEAVFLPGHTPGHTGFRVTGGNGLLIWADIVHVAPLQMPNPGTAIAFDADPQQAVATRLRLLDEVATDRTLVCGAHLPFPGFGHVEKAGEGYRFVPTDWQYQL